MSPVSQSGTSALELRLLGPLELVKDGSVVPLGAAKSRMLLATLALEPGRVVSVDRLVENLWPGDTPDTAVHAIQVHVSQLRKTLKAAIVTRAPGYALDLEPDQLDLHRFVRVSGEGREALRAGDPASAEAALREALALWRGRALADFLYEPFAQNEIARLEELRTVVIEDRIEADLALGRHAELVSELEALVAVQPLRERPRAQLMLALYRSGRQADALAAYRAARETLVEELGIDPGPELKALEAAILRQDASLLLSETAAAKPAMRFRRLVTVLFVDVVDSMALAGALDAEALGRVLQRFFETVSAAISRHGGTVEKYVGDAVMAVFGIPVSHEDDALRAARAALEVQAGLVALNEQLNAEHGVGLEVRTGLETGEVYATPTESQQRLVTGEAVGLAARLEQAAGADEIVVGELAGRLIDHAAVLEPLGELEIKGKREPVRAYRLVELTAVAPAFGRRLDAPLVGRELEVAALRKALKRAIDRAAAHAVVVVGSPGVGKSRLAAELDLQVRDTTMLSGRCLAYGEGITYWPLREIVLQTPPGEERDAVLAALEASTPPPAGEIAWIFRRLCEALARDKPLVLVVDDVHWAEPTFLDVLEQVADRAEGAILVVCLAREELLEARPDFLGGRENADRIMLDALSAEETDALLAGLGGAILESDHRARIVEAAEGNPFFLEQLVALALEGGLAERALPPTVQALLAARLDRLGPGERAVLERAAVISKEFSTDDISSLLEPDAVPTAGVHLRTLLGRGFVRPRGEDTYSFRHLLVHEAVYRAAPKRLRAELHERYADRLEQAHADLPELDEFVGYHLEQAYDLRVELGESDRRTKRLAEDGGRRLGAAGIRAWKRNDVPATVNLLRRATTLLPSRDRRRRELLCELGPALRSSGDPTRATGVLEAGIEASVEARDRATELRARLELEYVRLLHEPGTTAQPLLDTAAEAAQLFETVRDDRSLGRTRLIAGFVEGGHLGRHLRWQESAEQALISYRRVEWPTSTCLGEVAAALYYGPTPVPEAIARCEQLLRDPDADRVGEANVLAYLGGLVAQRGEFGEARKMIASASAIYDELGQRTAATTFCAAVLGEVELLAGDTASAERVLRELCDKLDQMGDFSHLASRANDLAEAIFRLERYDEAHEWTRLAESHAAGDDVDAQTLWRSVRAKIHARQGAAETAIELASEASRLVSASDGLNRLARVRADFADVLRVAGRRDEAADAAAGALQLYLQKGNLVAAARVQELLREPASA